CVHRTIARYRFLSSIPYTSLFRSRLDAPGTVTARVPWLAGKELVGAPDWIPSRVRTALPEGIGVPLPARSDQPAFLVELARWCRGRKRSPEWSDRCLG